MAKLHLILFTSLLFVVLALTEKQDHPYTYKAAAEICRPYFDACRASSKGNKAGMIKCLRGFKTECFTKVQEILESVKACVREAAGDNLDNVSKCIE